MTVDEVVSRFADVKPTGSGWKATCPTHEDQKASLSISCNGDKILIRCFAGCQTETVLAAVGLQMRDLFTSFDLKPSRPDYPIYYNYHAPDGTVRYRKKRTADK